MDLQLRIRQKGLKVTPSRVSIMKLLEGSKMAYSHAQLEMLTSEIDRVTIYRILNDFEEAGIVHKIIDIDGITRFALCKNTCPDEHHIDNHVHFNCMSCHEMFCIEKVHTPHLQLPTGFKITGSHTLIYGICKSCNVA